MEVTGETFTDVTGRMNCPNEWFGCGMSAAYERLLLTEGRTNQKTVLSLAEKGIDWRARQKNLCKRREAVVKETGANQRISQAGHSPA